MSHHNTLFGQSDLLGQPERMPYVLGNHRNNVHSHQPTYEALGVHLVVTEVGFFDYRELSLINCHSLNSLRPSSPRPLHKNTGDDFLLD